MERECEDYCEREVILRIEHTELLSKIHYDRQTGIFTDKKTGKIRGTFDESNGYYHLQINKKKYYAHRLAWFYVYGVWPDLHIDHINGNRLDNSFLNLREATRSENQWNKSFSKSNRLGVKGVRWVANRGRFRATISIDGKYKNVGSFLTLEEAADAYDKAALEYFGEYALTNKMIRERELESGRSD